MTIKKQWKTIKENWIIVLGLVLLVGLFFIGNMGGASYKSLATANYAMDYAESAYYDDEGMYMKSFAGGFAPEIVERKITKYANLRSEVRSGQFDSSVESLKNIVSESDSFLLSEDIGLYGEGKKAYSYGNFRIKVSTDNYSGVVSRLKEIGEVKSFREDMDDVTEQYTNIEIDIATEKARLERFKTMMNKSDRIEDQIQLADKIFSLERTIAYYEESLENMDSRIDYSTISFSLTEERPMLYGVVFVKFSELVETLVVSLNSLLYLVFAAIPYAIVIGLVVFGFKIFRKN